MSHTIWVILYDTFRNLDIYDLNFWIPKTNPYFSDQRYPGYRSPNPNYDLQFFCVVLCFQEFLFTKRQKVGFPVVLWRFRLNCRLLIGWLIGRGILKLYRLVTVKKNFDVDEKMVLRFFLTSKKWLLISLDTQKGWKRTSYGMNIGGATRHDDESVRGVVNRKIRMVQNLKTLLHQKMTSVKMAWTRHTRPKMAKNINHPTSDLIKLNRQEDEQKKT